MSRMRNLRNSRARISKTERLTMNRMTVLQNSKARINRLAKLIASPTTVLQNSKIRIKRLASLTTIPIIILQDSKVQINKLARPVITNRTIILRKSKGLVTRRTSLPMKMAIKALRSSLPVTLGKGTVVAVSPRHPVRAAESPYQAVDLERLKK